jgi:hypothetical protein
MLHLTPEMIIRPGHKVIAAEVESARARSAYARAKVAAIRLDPLWRPL